MVKSSQNGQTSWIRQASLATVLLGLSLSGCSSTGTNVTQQHEPLLGVRTPPSGVAAPPPQGSATTPHAVQPTPQTYNPSNPSAIPMSSNPATLAGTNWQGPLGRPLAIDDHNSTGPGFLPGQLTSTSRTPTNDGYLPPNPNPKVEQVPDVNPAPPKVAPITTWQTPPKETPSVKPVTAVTPTNSDGLAKQLQDRGVVDQKVDNTPQGLHLTCYVSRGPSGGLRILEVTAVDYPTAAQAILKQLETPR